MSRQSLALLNVSLIGLSSYEAFKKLNPLVLYKNPVMFVTMIGAVLTSLSVFTSELDREFIIHLSCWLWITVLFSNFAEAVAEGRGKAQAATLRKSQKETVARLMLDGQESKIPAADLKKGDLVICEAGDLIPSDGEVVEGIASVDEAAITGESAPVIRESGGDRSAVTGGTRVISDRIIIRITVEKGSSFIDRMIKMVEGAQRQKTPNELALTILLAALTLIFLLVCITLLPMGIYSKTDLPIPVLIALLICLIPTTIGGLLSAIGIAGMDRVMQHNVLAMSGKAVEAAGDISTLLLDKTGTITLGNRQATNFFPADGVTAKELANIAQLASLADETPEGRSIVVLAKSQFGIREPDIEASVPEFINFSAVTRMSGVNLNGKMIRKGAADAIKKHVENLSGIFPSDVQKMVDQIASAGGTPLVVVEDARVLGTIQLQDIVKGGIKNRFIQLRRMGIKTVMITGDNPLTAAAIAAEAGVDDFVAQATPEMKLAYIRKEQAEGRLVAMTGDGTNDAPALAQADVGLAMNTGTQAAREAGNMIDLDSNPTKLMEVVEIGKQLIMTRGALTTFSLANDIAKYFAILPAIFLTAYAVDGQAGPLVALNIMKLHSAESAILSAVIFNAIIIILLLPLALRGIAYRPLGAAAVLRHNLLVYGLGGLVVPFVGIKLIDLLLVSLRLL